MLKKWHHCEVWCTIVIYQCSAKKKLEIVIDYLYADTDNVMPVGKKKNLKLMYLAAQRIFYV